MKKSIFIIIIIAIMYIPDSHAQAPDLFWASVSAGVFGYSHGTVDAMKFREWYNKEPYLDSTWHQIQLVSYGSAVSLGISLAKYYVDSGHNMWRATKATFLSAIIFWITNDIAYNLGVGRNPFYVSSKSGSPFESISHIWIKAPLLVLAILIQ